MSPTNRLNKVEMLSPKPKPAPLIVVACPPNKRVKAAAKWPPKLCPVISDKSLMLALPKPALSTLTYSIVLLV